MSDETPDKPAVPQGGTAADSEATQVVPKITRPAAKKSATSVKEPAVEPAKDDSKVNGSAKADTNGSSVKSPAAKTVKEPTRPAAKAAPAKPAPSPAPKPFTAGDYAKASETSVMPRIVEEPAAAAPEPAAAADKPTRRLAHLQIVAVSPWSVTKVAFALSVALAVVTFVAVSILWVVLGIFGVWDAINSSVSLLSDDADAFQIQDYVGYGRIIGLTLVISAINVILITAIATIGAFLYNLATQLLGGIDVTLADDR